MIRLGEPITVACCCQPDPIAPLIVGYQDMFSLDCACLLIVHDEKILLATLRTKLRLELAQDPNLAGNEGSSIGRC